MLQLVAARLRTFVTSSRMLAPVGGDEFALVIEAQPVSAHDDCPAHGIMASLPRPFLVETGVEISLAFSAELAWIGAHDGGVEALMRQANAALRQAKTDGSGCLRVFDHDMDARFRDRTRLEGDLRRALENDAIVPFFQPLVELRTGCVVGVEALARWHHPERAWVPPAEFILLAEDLGLIGALTERLLRRACEETLRWPASLTVAFNVSPIQLRDDTLPKQIRAILAETGFPARRLEVEVTESTLVKDLHLDDFGTGYSSLKHLRCLPFDKLKIDAGFVGGMMDDLESGEIVAVAVAVVVGLGHSLGLSTVAEGVETPQVADLLRDLGCDMGQGWLYGRPVSAAELAPVIAKESLPILAA